MPGELLLWEKLLTGEKGETVESAFFEYFGRGEFFPKPANILEIIRTNREKKYAGNYKPIDRVALEREQSTEAWQESSRRARETLARIAGMSQEKKMP